MQSVKIKCQIQRVLQKHEVSTVVTFTHGSVVGGCHLRVIATNRKITDITGGQQ